MAVFILEYALSFWTNLGKHLLFFWLFASSIKTATRRIIRLDELFSVVPGVPDRAARLKPRSALQAGIELAGNRIN